MAAFGELIVLVKHKLGSWPALQAVYVLLHRRVVLEINMVRQFGFCENDGKANHYICCRERVSDQVWLSTLAAKLILQQLQQDRCCSASGLPAPGAETVEGVQIPSEYFRSR